MDGPYEFFIQTKSQEMRDKVAARLAEKSIGAITNRWKDWSFNLVCHFTSEVDRLHELMETEFESIEYRLI